MPEILVPPDLNGERFHCLVCGSILLSPRAYERHVTKCAAEHAAEIETYRNWKHPEMLQPADPEYREWQQRTGKLI